MQLLALALYHRDGRPEPRIIRFRPGALNILTGESETGKSEVLDIVDYCMGRNQPNLPDEPIDQTVGWFALLVTFGSTRMVLARPRPTGASTSKAMILIGDEMLDVPPAAELRANADTVAIRTELSARLGIEDIRFQPPPGAARSAFDVSIAQAALLCFQKQNEIANQSALFHRQNEGGIAQAIKDTLPYFLGAAGPGQALRHYQLNESLRAQRVAQRQLDDATRRREGGDVRVMALIRLAESEGLLRDVPPDIDSEQTQQFLARALEVPVLSIEPSVTEDRRQQLTEERRRLRDQWQQLNEALDLVERWHKQGHAFTGELHLQIDRLKTLELLGPQGDDQSSNVCPMCARPLEEPDSDASDIVRLTRRLARELADAETLQPVRERHRTSLQAERDTVRVSLQINAAALQELNASDERMRHLQEQQARLAFVQGRITQERAAASEASPDDVKRLRRSLILLQERVQALQALVDEDDIAAETENRLTSVASLMTLWARRLSLGQAAAADEVRISLAQLNVVVRRPNGRLSLTRIGSAKIGSATTLSLTLRSTFTSCEMGGLCPDS